MDCNMQDSLWGRMMKAMNYKPGWWALYFLYCIIPVVAYIWYLYKQIREVQHSRVEVKNICLIKCNILYTVVVQ